MLNWEYSLSKDITSKGHYTMNFNITHDFQVKGIHRGIKYCINSDGWDFYYSTKSGLTGMSIRGVTRMLDCKFQTISNVVQNLEKASVKFRFSEGIEMYTEPGLRSVKLIMEDELPAILEYICTSKRIKKQTRDNALKVQSKFVRAGFRLLALLEVAPEVVAKEAIAKIDDPEAAKEVAEHAVRHHKYIETYHGVHDELKAHGCEGIHHATYNKQVNELIGVPMGKRPKMTQRQKDEMLLVQVHGKLTLQDNADVKEWDAVNLAVDAGDKALAPYKHLKLKKSDD